MNKGCLHYLVWSFVIIIFVIAIGMTVWESLPGVMQVICVVGVGGYILKRIFK